MKIALIFALTVASSFALADNYTKGHVRQDGTYVEGHYKSAPDRNPYNNYSTQGNSNPYTGQQGTRDAGKVQEQYGERRDSGNSYGQPPKQRSGW